MLKTLSLLVLPLVLAPASAAIPGTWKIQGDVMGVPVNDVCTIQRNGAALSGSCVMDDGVTYELTGEVRDGNFTFQHGGEYDGEVLTIIYSGTLPPAGEMAGRIDVMPFQVTGDFTATLVPAGQ